MAVAISTLDRFEIQIEPEVAAPLGNQITGEIADVGAQVDTFEILRLIQLLVDESHRIDAIATLCQDGLRVGIIGECRLPPQQARDDLHVVLDPVIDLLKQHLFLFE